MNEQFQNKLSKLQPLLENYKDNRHLNFFLYVASRYPTIRFSAYDNLILGKGDDMSNLFIGFLNYQDGTDIHAFNIVLNKNELVFALMDSESGASGLIYVNWEIEPPQNLNENVMSVIDKTIQMICKNGGQYTIMGGRPLDISMNKQYSLIIKPFKE